MYATMTPEQMVSRLLYRDGLMLVIDKPAGLAVHRGPNGGESLEDHFDALRFGLPRAPALAHRLDRDTSGCLVLGRHRKALAQLGKLFKNGAIDKTYWAVVEGVPDGDEGEIALPLGRLDETRGWWMKHDPEGQPAVTRWKVMGSPPPCREGKITWLALEPLTGRTHQTADAPPARNGLPAPPIRGIRSTARRRRSGGPGLPHTAGALRDGLADPRRYDLRHGAAQRGPGTATAAREIVLPLYRNRAPIRISAPVPPHMRERLAACGWPGEDSDAFYIRSREAAVAQ